MSQSRNAFRYRVDRPVRVHLGGDPQGLLARSLNLSRTGMGVCLDLPYSPLDLETLDMLDTPSPRSGDRLRVVLHDEIEGKPLFRQWSGRVTHAKIGCGGGRIGIAFEWPEGQGVRSRAEVESSPRNAGNWPLLDGQDPVSMRPDLQPLALAIAGFAADQASKAWALAAAGCIPGGMHELATGFLAVSPASNPGALGSLADDLAYTGPICAAASLALMGLASRREMSAQGRAGATGLGLLAAGMLGNSADRIFLGHVRDFLVLSALPRLTFNLADVLILAGAATLLATHVNRPSKSVEIT